MKPPTNDWESGERELAQMTYCAEQPPRVPHEPSPSINMAIFEELFVRPSLATGPDVVAEPEPADEPDDVLSAVRRLALDALRYLGRSLAALAGFGALR